MHSAYLNDIMKMMNSINPDFVEKYQILYQKDPESKIFAPLAEAYRKLGMIKEAHKVAENGVKHHPHFPSGRVALAKILLDKKDLLGAIDHLKKVTEMAPENVLAHTLLAKSYMDLRKPKDALAAYKMLLFINPNHKLAQSAVKRLESLEAEDFDEEIFQYKNLIQSDEGIKIIEEKGQDLSKPKNAKNYLERVLSLSDAYIVRNEPDKAKKTLLAALEKLGENLEIEKRLNMLEKREEPNKTQGLTKKIAFLERLLLRIDKNMTAY